MRERLTRDPAWCHECGTYSFIDEWGADREDIWDEVCPECGERWPSMGGPLLLDDTPEAFARAYRAAANREVVW